MYLKSKKKQEKKKKKNRDRWVARGTPKTACGKASTAETMRQKQASQRQKKANFPKKCEEMGLVKGSG